MHTRLIASLSALLAAGTSASVLTPAANPRDDFECAVVFDFFHRVAEAKPALADLREKTAIMSSWYMAKYMEHPSQDPGRHARYEALVIDLGENGNAYGDMLKGCSSRANADPLFPQFVKAFRETPAK